MTVLDRLKMELSNQEYFIDTQYIQFLSENKLTYTDSYDKKTMQRALLLTVLDILEAIANDVDLLRNISTEFSNVSEAYQFLEIRMAQIKDRIAQIPPDPEMGEFNPFSLMFTRGGIPAISAFVRPIRKETLDEIIEEVFDE